MMSQDSYLNKFIETHHFHHNHDSVDIRGNTLYFSFTHIPSNLKGLKIPFPKFVKVGYDDVLLFNNSNKIVRLQYKTSNGIDYSFDIPPGESHLHYTGNFIVKNSVTIRSINGTMNAGYIDIYFNHDNVPITSTSTTTTTSTTTSSTSTSSTSSTSTTSTTSTSTSTTSTSTSTTTTTLQIFDTQLTFTTDTYDFKEGVSGQALAVNPILKLEFNKILDPVGLYNTMTISVGGTPIMLVNYRIEYFNMPFRFTHTSGYFYHGVFNNDINF